MTRELTITVSEETYRGLEAVAGSRTISQFIEDLARPLVAQASLDASYREMGLDAERENDALDWSEALIQDWPAGGPDVAR